MLCIINSAPSSVYPTSPVVVQTCKRVLYCVSVYSIIMSIHVNWVLLFSSLYIFHMLSLCFCMHIFFHWYLDRIAIVHFCYDVFHAMDLVAYSICLLLLWVLLLVFPMSFFIINIKTLNRYTVYKELYYSLVIVDESNDKVE